MADLFQINCDYISYHVTVKLRRVERNPGVLDVVEVVTKYSTMDFLPQLKEIVYDLLLQSSSNIQKRNIQSFLKVFYAFVICVKRLTSKNDSKPNENNLEELNPLNPTTIILNNLTEFYKAKEDAKLFENEDVESDIDENVHNNDENNTNVNINEFSDFNEGIYRVILNIIYFIFTNNLHFLI
jgi:hypothetical protein